VKRALPLYALTGVAAIVVAGIAALVLRVVIEGKSALAKGDEAAAAGRFPDAIAAWETAARWYLPLAPHVDDAYDRLRDLAKSKKSIVAWRAIRTAALATRGPWQPHEADLAEANAAIAELAAADPERAPIGGTDPVAHAAYQTAGLTASTRPNLGSSFLAIAGIACWLAGMAALIRRPTWIRGVVAAGGVLAWALGLYTV
jgi:hypothetical protein